MTALFILAIAGAAFVATMAGGLLALRLKAHLPLVLAFSAGAVLGVALFDLAPEAVAAGADRYGLPVLLAVAAGGFLLYALLDRVMAGHDRDGAANPARGVIGAASFSAHSVLDGLAMGVAFQTNHAMGIVVAAAVLAHDFADGLNTVNVVARHGGSRSRAIGWLTVDALAPVIGAALSLMIAPQEGVLALLLALFFGVFLFIGASGLMLHGHRAWARPGTAIASLLGAGFLYLVTTLVR